MLTTKCVFVYCPDMSKSTAKKSTPVSEDPMMQRSACLPFTQWAYLDEKAGFGSVNAYLRALVAADMKKNGVKGEVEKRMAAGASAPG